jgi:hypothetical protein
MLNKYILLGAILTAIGAYSIGSYRGMHNEAIKNQLLTLKSQVAGLNKKIEIEKQIQDKIQIQANKLEMELKENEGKYQTAKDQIIKDREYINTHNTIRNSFVQRISTAPVPAYATTSYQPITSDRIISSDRILYFIKDLQQHDDQCVFKYNTLLNVYNDQLKIINR